MSDEPRVRNLRFEGITDNCVRVDRKTKWGNPFVMRHESERAAVIAKYREYLKGKPELFAALPELRGKDLACWCSPLPCHGDVLLELANQQPKQELANK